MITKESIKSQQDVKIEKVEIPEWNDFIYVKSMSGKERDQFENEMYSRGENGEMVSNLENLRARMIVLTACDDKGNRIFKDADAEWLGEKNAAALNRIFNKANELSGFRKQDIDKLVKNSEGGQSDASTSE